MATKKKAKPKPVLSPEEKKLKDAKQAQYQKNYREKLKLKNNPPPAPAEEENIFPRKGKKRDPAQPAPTQAKKQLEKLISDTGEIANRKTEKVLPRGLEIESEYQRNDPTIKTVPPQQQQATPLPSQTPPPQAAVHTQPPPQPQPPPINNNDPDAIPHILNGTPSILIAKFMKRDLSDIVFSKEEMEGFRALQPEGGVNVRSWWIYFPTIISAMIGKAMMAKKIESEQPTSLEPMIDELRKMGYTIQAPQADLNSAIEMLRKNGFTVARVQMVKDEPQVMNVDNIEQK